MSIVISENSAIRFGQARVHSSELRSKLEDTSASALKDLRVVPILCAAPIHKNRKTVAVGHSVLGIQNDGAFFLEIVLTDVWSIGQSIGEPQKNRRTKTARSVVEHYRTTAKGSKIASELLSLIWAETISVVDLDLPDDGNIALPKIAKSICEMSRNNVAVVRDIRYELESKFALASDSSSSSEEYTNIIAQLLQLNIISSKAADQAREAIREGLWTYVCHSDIYHSYRKLQDPSLLNRFDPATIETSPWIRSHDAAVRQCVQMQEQMERESQTIQALISSATGISSSREADAQSRFNLLVALVSIGIGIPALFLAMYGASDVFRFENVSSITAIAPVGLSLLAAALVAIVKAPLGVTRKLWYWCGSVALLLLITLVSMVLYFSPASPFSWN